MVVINYLKFFYEYLNSLSLWELSALYHLIELVVIAILTFNVLSAVLGNEIIKYFKLEESFPKLSAFLRLRLKFQKYYLTLSFSRVANIFINFRKYSNKSVSFIIKFFTIICRLE
jgi:hypothetical protein